jgi:hypothetical protein
VRKAWSIHRRQTLCAQRYNHREGDTTSCQLRAQVVEANGGVLNGKAAAADDRSVGGPRPETYQSLGKGAFLMSLLMAVIEAASPIKGDEQRAANKSFNRTPSPGFYC